MIKPIIDNHKLTKSFFMGLDAGVYLVSSLGGFSPLDPHVFEDYVVSSDKRTSQWVQIKDARADQRGCNVFANKEDYNEWQKAWKHRPDGKGWYREKE